MRSSFFFLSGCYLVRPIKSNCFGQKRTRAETTIKRVPGLGGGDKESKLSTLRSNNKNDNHVQREEAVECQL